MPWRRWRKRGRKHYLRRGSLLVASIAAVSLWTLYLTADGSQPQGVVTYIGCHATERDFRASTVSLANGTLTPNSCGAACKQRGYYYALLRAGDRCLCSHFAYTGAMRLPAACDALCPGDAEQNCGGNNTVSIYSIRVPDGFLEWTPWMRLEASEIHTRYRGCNRQQPMCKAKFERKIDSELDKWQDAYLKHYIGCFTMESHPEGTSMENDWPDMVKPCFTTCSWKKFPLIAIRTIDNVRTCLCLTSLGTSLPSNTCFNLYGLQVFSAMKFNDSLQLSFVEPAIQKKVLLVDHYWSGAFNAPFILSKYPGAFHTDEPESVFGSDTSLMKAGANGSLYRKSTHLSMVLDPYFNCDMYRISGWFLRLYPTHNVKANEGYSTYKTCKSLFDGHSGVEQCRPVLEESCRRSPVVSAKTTWHFEEAALQDFIKRRSDVDVIQVVRDPRKTITLQNSLGKVPKNTTASRALNLCSGIISLSSILEDTTTGSRIGTLLYEDLIDSPPEEATSLYKFLGLNPSQDFLKEIGGWYREAKSWSPATDNKTLKIVDEQCTRVYEKFFSRPLSITAISRRLEDRLPTRG